eukprot:COSAG04_NODE_1102_length_8251_cov_3.245339_7_plen_47_part_00
MKLADHLQSQLPQMYHQFKDKLKQLDVELSTTVKPSWEVVEQMLLT